MLQSEILLHSLLLHLITDAKCLFRLRRKVNNYFHLLQTLAELLWFKFTIFYFSECPNFYYLCRVSRNMLLMNSFKLSVKGLNEFNSVMRF